MRDYTLYDANLFVGLDLEMIQYAINLGQLIPLSNLDSCCLQIEQVCFPNPIFPIPNLVIL